MKHTKSRARAVALGALLACAIAIPATGTASAAKPQPPQGTIVVDDGGVSVDAKVDLGGASLTMRSGIRW